VAEVRVLGGIGVVEMERPVRCARSSDVWSRRASGCVPFGRLVYLMPPYVISDAELTRLCAAVVEVIGERSGF
jgi:adenosylmethionine---8-amino-7-oxononanoate aminotransferase